MKEISILQRRLPMDVLYTEKLSVRQAMANTITITSGYAYFGCKSLKRLLMVKDCVPAENWHPDDFYNTGPAWVYKLGQTVYGVVSGCTSYLPGPDETVQHIEHHETPIKAMQHVMVNTESGVPLTDMTVLNKFYCEQADDQQKERCIVPCPYCESL